MRVLLPLPLFLKLWLANISSHLTQFSKPSLLSHFAVISNDSSLTTT